MSVSCQLHMLPPSMLALGAGPADGAPAAAALGSVVPVWSALPFLGILLSIALFPLLAPRFWRRHYPKVATGWALVLAVPLLAAYRSLALQAFAHAAIADYCPFVVLLGSLYTIGRSTR